MWQLLDTGVAFVRINENDDEDATSVAVAADDDGGDPPDRTLIFGATDRQQRFGVSVVSGSPD